MSTAPGDRPISLVLQDIFTNVQDIVRSEMRLAKRELTDEVAKAGAATLLVAGGALASIFAAGFVLLAAVYALASVTPFWLAALIVALCAGIIAAIALSAGLKRFRTVRA